MSLDDKLDKAFGIAKKEALHPPVPPKSIVSEIEERSSVATQPKVINTITPNSKLTIDFNRLDPQYQKWCLSLETQRHWYYTRFGQTHRGSTRTIKTASKKRQQDLDIIELMKKEKAPLYRECMQELLEKLREIKID